LNFPYLLCRHWAAVDCAHTLAVGPILTDGATTMPDRFESDVFDPVTTALMKAALEVALLKRKPSRTEEAETKKLLASAIIDQVNTGERNRQKIVDVALATLAVAENLSP
jgi:hypothetical protein